MVADNFDLLEEHSIRSAGCYFREVVKIIDEQFEEGFSKNHPELIAALAGVAETEFQSAMVARISKRLGIGLYEIASSLEDVSDALVSDCG
ncbi:MAG: hypothetical protein NC112_02145 [Oxalobacter formigenes]|nr:hypothetical protein [Oxalobacter formigenes]